MVIFIDGNIHEYGTQETRL